MNGAVWWILIYVCVSETICTINIQDNKRICSSRMSLCLIIIRPLLWSRSLLSVVCPYRLKFSWILCKWNCSVCTLLCLASWFQHNYFEIHLLCVSIAHTFLLLSSSPLYGYIMICLSVREHLRWFLGFWLSHKQHMVRSCSFIQSISLRFSWIYI